MCEQFSPSLITTSHHKSINYDSSFIPWDLNFKTDTRLWCCCHEGESRFTAHIRTRITQSAYDFMFFFFFYGRPTLLSLIAARSVQQHFYERLPPINLPLIPHMKVMSLLMVTEVWSVSLIEIALHLGGNKHYSFMFPKAECGFWIRRARVIWLAYTSNVVICGMWFEAWAFSYSTTLLRVLYWTLLLDFTKLAICNYSRVLNWTKPSASVNRRGKRSQVLNVA